MRDITERATRGREEQRSFTVDDLEIRAEGDKVTFDGVASVVGVAYTVRDQFGEFQETILPGAFNRTLAQRDDVRMLKNHDRNYVFARTKSGTLNLSVGPNLRSVADLDPANPNVQVLRSEMGRGDVDQMSIGMNVKDDVWSEDYSERQVREVALRDTSVVTFPCSETTTAALRHLDEAVRAFTETEEWDDATLARAIAHLESLRAPAPVPHDYVDSAGDGMCDVCGMPADGHMTMARSENVPDVRGLYAELWRKRIPA